MNQGTSSDRESINTSLSTLRERLASSFQGEIQEQICFGSFQRGTILPRSMDANSDVDYMVVFKDGGFRPQTYLDKLRRFVEARYSRSEISQSHPVIQLKLNHICFELVPATKNFLYGYSIPERDGTEQNWISTDPKSMNGILIEKDAANKHLIKPLIKLVKYWNVCNGCPFESYKLEKMILDFEFGYIGLFLPDDIEGYFYEFMSNLSISYLEADWKIECVKKVQEVITKAKEYKRLNRNDLAEMEIKKILRPIAVTRKSLLG